VNKEKPKLFVERFVNNRWFFVEATEQDLYEAGWIKESQVCKPYCDDCFKDLLEVDRGVILCGACWAARGYSEMSIEAEWKQKIRELINHVDYEADENTISEDAKSVRDWFVRKLEKLIEEGDEK